MNTVDLVASFMVGLLVLWGIGGAAVLLWSGAVYGHDWWVRCRDRRQFDELTRGL